jgi:hypothetical protein
MANFLEISPRRELTPVSSENLKLKWSLGRALGYSIYFRPILP